jgi:YVTN family beta-propeller protein
MNRHTSLALVGAVLLLGHAPAAEPIKRVQVIPFKGVDGKLDHLAVDADGQRLFVANKPNNSLDVIDLKSGKLVKQIADQGKPSGVVYAADLDMVYVGNGAGTCNAFSGKDYKRVFSTKVVKADNVQYDAASRMVYVAHGKTLTQLDAKSGEVKADIAMPGSIHGFRIDGKAKKAFASITAPNVVAVIDLATGKVVGKFPLTLAEGNSPIAYDAAGGRVFVGCRKKPLVVVLDAKTGKELTSVPIADGIDDLHFDPALGRLYASCGDGALVVIGGKGDKYTEVGRVKTPKSARTCAFSPKTGRLYLGVPKQDGKDGPEVWVYETNAKR